ncbi:bifunctional 4-hydroxy-2-oxoglutarate aldolase/2-dehydro-3-deoxy-phosphogluconate aldolase [Alicyclobacillus sp. SO9]|uniref:bifunctional 4-hydroxy-2-oxoglutarate aldolase/2-dehydro-3-deoxy-phosphogluconate aldolase n=1 Tax=Alicyclobacillus sp. SO9 TaxID=2665646 RepID=UPI0018E70B82|nr:bifunctional 4-hydroxy-2-oxoglutarate aldolase/2-dehydro-3-deoxy-phosphogluconate aldolase [Alicyclobacillus sp. SO9]QQE77926.1 bifunctional 4-hydroxy-2-oxoglutarate aldolase/2-dehydro-3-deoxy-phosphogluconate aldolase [Alicyclobacillus sp. SO9]
MNEENSIAQRVEEAGVIAIFRKLPPAVIAPLAEALVEAGIRAIELTVESEGAYESIRMIRDRFASDVVVGAGTLMTKDDIAQAVDAGADFLLSPHLDVDLLAAAHELGVPMTPGIATPTEVVQAVHAGAQTLKLFPAAPLGPAYLKDLLGPFKGKQFIPTGGITATNAADFIQAGAIAVGMGSSLATTDEISRQDWAAIQTRVRTALREVHEAKAAR